MIRLVWPLLQNPVYKVFWHRDWLLPSCLALQFSVHCPYKTLDRVSMPDDIGSCPNGGRIPGICARPTTARRPLRLTGDQCWTKHRLNPTDIAEELTIGCSHRLVGVLKVQTFAAWPLHGSQSLTFQTHHRGFPPLAASKLTNGTTVTVYVLTPMDPCILRIL